MNPRCVSGRTLLTPRGPKPPGPSERPGFRLSRPSAAPPLRSTPPGRGAVSPSREIAGEKPARRPRPVPLVASLLPCGRIFAPKTASPRRVLLPPVTAPAARRHADADPRQEPADRELDLPPEAAAPKRPHPRGRVALPRRAASLRCFRPLARRPQPRRTSGGFARGYSPRHSLVPQRWYLLQKCIQ